MGRAQTRTHGISDGTEMKRLPGVASSPPCVRRANRYPLVAGDGEGRAELGARVWGNSVTKQPSRSSTGFCAGAAEFGHPGHPPLPGHGRTRLPCAFNPVAAAIAAVVVHFGAVMIG